MIQLERVAPVIAAALSGMAIFLSMGLAGTVSPGPGVLWIVALLAPVPVLWFAFRAAHGWAAFLVALVAYALGSCNFGFRLTFPRADALVGAGVSAQDLLTMETAGTDRFQTTVSGSNGYISGIATNQGQTKSFTWLFRQSWSFQNCSVQTATGLQTSLQLGAYEAETTDIMVQGESLFQNQNASNQLQLLFEPMAQADSKFGNNDGDVTLDELSNVPVTAIAGDGASTKFSGFDAGLGDLALDAGVSIPTDLEGLVYQVLYPSMFRYADSGQCQVTLAGNGRGED